MSITRTAGSAVSHLNAAATEQLAISPIPIPGLTDRLTNTVGGWIMGLVLLGCLIGFIVGAGFWVWDRYFEGHGGKKGIGGMCVAVVAAFLVYSAGSIFGAIN